MDIERTASDATTAGQQEDPMSRLQSGLNGLSNRDLRMAKSPSKMPSLAQLAKRFPVGQVLQGFGFTKLD